MIPEGNDFRMAGAQNMAFDVEHLAIRQSGPVMVASFGVERCKVVLNDRNLVMLLSEAALPDSQRLLQDWFSFGDPVLASSKGPRTARSLPAQQVRTRYSEIAL